MKSFVSAIAKKKVRKLRERGLTIEEVAYELGCSRSTVRVYLKEANYKFRKYRRKV